MDVYARLIAHVSRVNYDLAREILKHLLNAYESSFEKETFSWIKIRCFTRFFGELVKCNVLSLASFVHILDVLTSAMKDSTDDNLAYLALSTLPWMGATLQEKDPEKLASILADLENKQNELERQSDESFAVFSSSDSAVKDNGLRLKDCLIKVKAMAENGWKSYFIVNSTNDNNGMEEDLVIHDIKPFSSASFAGLQVKKLAKENRPLKPFYPFDEAAESYPAEDSIDRWILHELLWCAISSYEINHRECIRMLMEKFNMSQPCNLHRAIVETVMEDLLQVAGPSFRSVFHAVVLMGCCKAAPTSIPKEIGRIIYMVYDKAESMNFPLIDRFTDWFSHHLSNFDFKWNWQDW